MRIFWAFTGAAVVLSAASVLTLAVPASRQDGVLKQAPRQVSSSEAGVGRFVAEATFKDLSGKSRSLRSCAAKNGLVIAFTSTSCPVTKKYLPSLAALQKEAQGLGFGMLLVNPVKSDSPSEIRAALKANNLTAPYCLDLKGQFVGLLGATTTAEAFVIDSSGTLAYRGALDDQYGIGYALDAPKRRFVSEAMEAVAASSMPRTCATTAPGCALEKSETEIKVATTYHARISRIVQSKCLECHRTGGVAPFSLETYKDVASHAAMIKQVTENGTMPPWFAAKPKAGEPSKWANDRSLSDSEKRDLLGWLSGSKPEGNPKDAPLPRKFGEAGWSIGKPDAIFEMSRAVRVKATGTMPYQLIDTDTKLTEDKWVQAMEVRPGAKAVVHHVLVFVRKPGETSRRDSDEGGGFFAAYVPGNPAVVYPDGFAKKIPAGSTLRFQMHYTPNGTAVDDRTSLAVRYASAPPKHEVQVAGIAGITLRIPPGAENHPEVAKFKVPINVKAMAFMPHMHVRAKAAKYELIGADGKVNTLLDVPRYDFNWQLRYELAEPMEFKAGSTVKFTGWFDNSAKNPSNPDPTKTVRWGPQTFDEMLLGYVEYYIDGPVGASPTIGRRPAVGALGGGENLEALFKRLDKNSDGKLTREELPRPALFDRIDLNKDGFVTLEEAKKVLGGGLSRH